MRAPGEGNDFLNIFYVKTVATGMLFLLSCVWLWWVWVLWLGRGSATAAPGGGPELRYTPGPQEGARVPLPGP